MPKSGTGWGRAGHRRAVLIGTLALCLLVGGSVAAWAEVSGGSTGYRMATVTRADIGTTLTVVGTVAPVSQAAASFQVGGKVTTVTVSPGQSVTAGQTLGTLDATALSESVSSAESTLNSDTAKLAEDEADESNGNSSGSQPPSSSTTPSTTTTTTAPTHGGGNPSGSAGSQSAVITQDQATLTQDEAALSTAQQHEAADLTQAQSDCTSAKTGTTTGQATCETALETVSADEQQVSKDQTTVSKDEATLAQALATAAGTGSGPSNPSGGSTGNTGTSPTQGGKALDATGNSGAGSTGNTGTGKTDGSGTSPGTSGNGSSGNGTSGSGTSGNGGSTNVVTPAQIASDQAAIDTAEADLTEAQQALDEATLTSPISGTVVSVGINVGDTVSAGSSTEIVTIIGTRSYEVQATLDSSQIPLVKTGQSATVEVDGVDGTLAGTVSQVGPVQSTSNGYTYPVIIALPSSSGGLYSGSTANVVISTGEVSHVVAVPTSAVQTLGARSFVLELSQGQLTRKFIKIGMVGVVYTQVDSGLSPGDSVVLVDYADAVPSSNTNSLGGVGSFLGGGGGNTFLGGGPGFFFRPGQAKSVVGGAGG